MHRLHSPKRRRQRPQVQSTTVVKSRKVNTNTVELDVKELGTVQGSERKWRRCAERPRAILLITRCNAEDDLAALIGDTRNAADFRPG